MECAMTAMLNMVDIFIMLRGDLADDYTLDTADIQIRLDSEGQYALEEPNTTTSKPACPQQQN